MTTDNDKIQQAYNDAQEAWVKQQEDLVKELGVSDNTAGAIWYLRTRARWTQEREDEIVRLEKAGTPIPTADIISGEWPYDRKAGEEIMKELKELGLDKSEQ